MKRTYKVFEKVGSGYAKSNGSFGSLKDAKLHVAFLESMGISAYWA